MKEPIELLRRVIQASDRYAIYNEVLAALQWLEKMSSDMEYAGACFSFLDALIQATYDSGYYSGRLYERRVRETSEIPEDDWLGEDELSDFLVDAIAWREHIKNSINSIP